MRNKIGGITLFTANCPHWSAVVVEAMHVMRLICSSNLSIATKQKTLTECSGKKEFKRERLLHTVTATV